MMKYVGNQHVNECYELIGKLIADNKEQLVPA